MIAVDDFLRKLDVNFFLQQDIYILHPVKIFIQMITMFFKWIKIEILLTINGVDKKMT
jgi:hypothetical protein